MPHAATLRLRVAMEQRARRVEMENLLHSLNPKLEEPEHTLPSESGPPQHLFPASSSDTVFSPSRRVLSSHHHCLGFIVDAVEDAEGVYDEEGPDAFTIRYVLDLAPKEKEDHDDDGDGRDDEKKQPQQPQQQQQQQNKTEDHLSSVLRGRHGVRHRCGDSSPAAAGKMNFINCNNRGRGSRLLSKSPHTITHDLLPIVCEFVNSRLGHLGLQSISIPSLAFTREHSLTVTETLLNLWIDTRSGSMLRLKNLWMSDSVNFSPRDYSRIVECLKRNRMQCLAVDRQHFSLQQAVERASTVMEWCGGRRQQEVREERAMLRELQGLERDEEELGGNNLADDATSYKMREVEFDKNRRMVRAQRKLEVREKNWVGAGGLYLERAKAGQQQHRRPSSSAASKPPLPAEAFGGHRRNNNSAVSPDTTFATSNNNHDSSSSPSAQRPPAAAAAAAASRRTSTRASRLRMDANSRKKSPDCQKQQSGEDDQQQQQRSPSPPHETDDLADPTTPRSEFDEDSEEQKQQENNNNVPQAASSGAAAAAALKTPQKQRQQKMRRGKRDPGTISEVELQGPFSRVIRAESSRRYRLMSIELDSLVPVLVAMQISLTAAQEREATSKR